jgi:hypothetical protein
MNLWAFRFVLWYICIMLVQPQIRFTFLWPLRIANLSFIIATGLHIMSCMESRRPLIRVGPATILGLALLFFATLSQQLGMYQVTSAWNPYYDLIVKNALLLIMIEAMASSIERVWAVQMTMLFSTLWWVKGGLRLSQAGATYAGDRLFSVGVSLIDNPNGFAYYMCILLPLYLYAFQRATKKWVKMAFLACGLGAIYIVFETGSRTGLVTLAVIGMFLLPHYGRNHFKALAFIAVALVFIFPMTGEKNKERFRTIPKSIAAFLGGGREAKPAALMTQDEQSADERKKKNQDTWQLIQTYPVFGVGIFPDESKFVEKFPMARGEVHCEILMAGRQMGMIGMGIYAGLVGTIFFGGAWIKRNARHWPAVRDLGWTFQMQGLVIAVGGLFCPLPWNPITMILAGSVSAMVGLLKAEKEAALVKAASGQPQ